MQTSLPVYSSLQGENLPQNAHSLTCKEAAASNRLQYSMLHTADKKSKGTRQFNKTSREASEPYWKVVYKVIT